MSEFGPRRNLGRLDRLRALGFFIVAMMYFLFAQVLSASAARGLTSGDWRELISRTLLLFLLVIGYAGMGYAFQLQREPVKAMGLFRREGWKREFGLGVALGWGGVLACVLPIALAGDLVITLWSTPRQFGILLLNIVVLAIASLGEEVAFRGYPFQRLIEAIGPTTATILMALFFGLIHLRNPGATSASTLVTVLSGILLATAYLQTRALWLPWGFHFGWNTVMAVLFGLPVSGLNFSAVIESNSIGPRWLTGGSYGPEGSLTAVVVLVVALVVLVKTTREYAWKYAQPVIVPGGIPVDLDAAATRMHQAAQVQSAEPAASNLVQIAAVTSQSPSVIAPSPQKMEAGTEPRSEAPGKIEAELPAETEPPI
ncbi:MAG TPA: type II CAAX endopeptidase family protein [Acidisarcina sp.]|nr:type II CAAX endopeptidase family protein [Acidisarcina sp.]